MKKKKGLGSKVSLFAAIVLMAVMTLLFLVVNYSISGLLSRNAEKSITNLAEDRAKFIDLYLGNYENFLANYTKASEIINAVENPDDKQLVAAAQDYTDRYAESIPNIEGLYICDTDTTVYAHIKRESVGVPFRFGEDLEDLRRGVKSCDGVYNAKIRMSPVTGNQVIPFFAPFYDKKGNLIGMAGAAFYANNLEEDLDELTKSDYKNAHYYLISTEDKKYIFNNNREKVGEVCDNPEILNIIDKLSVTSNSGYYHSKINKEKYIMAYYYMADRNLLLVVADPEDEVYAQVPATRMIIVTIMIIFTTALVSGTLIVTNRMMRPLEIIEAAIDRLKNGDYTHDRKIDECKARNDEYGKIAVSVECLEQTLANRNEMYTQMLRMQSNGFISIDNESGNILLINESAREILGIPSYVSMTGNVDKLFNLIGSDNADQLRVLYETLKNNGEEIATEYGFTHIGGKTILTLVRAKMVTLASEQQVITFSLTDVSEKKRMESELASLSEVDALTGLLNRRYGEIKVRQAIAAGNVGMYCLIDVDKFKEINEKYGYNVGDEILKEIARVLEKTFRGTDILARVGGNAFAVYVTGVRRHEVGEKLIQRFNEYINTMVVPGAPDCKIRLSIGAMICHDDEEFTALFKKTDAAMKHCKTMDELFEWSN